MADAKKSSKAEEAPFGWDVVGEDGRRIVRSLPKHDAEVEAARISSATGEEIKAVPAEISAPSVASLPAE